MKGTTPMLWKLLLLAPLASGPGAFGQGNVAEPIMTVMEDAAKELMEKLDVKEAKDPTSGEKTVTAELVVQCTRSAKTADCAIEGDGGKKLVAVSGATAREIFDSLTAKPTKSGDVAAKRFKGKANLRCFCNYGGGKGSGYYCSIKEGDGFAGQGPNGGPTGILTAPHPP